MSRFILPLFFLTLVPAYASALPFSVGERLEFKLSWSGISAGTTVMEVKEIANIGEREAFHMVSRSKPSKFVSAFYEVNNWTDFYIDAKTLAPLKYEVLREKKGRKQRKSAIFDLKRNEVEFTKDGKKKIVKVTEGIIDPFSIVYYLRSRELKPKEVIELDTFSNGKLYTTHIEVIGREKVDVEAGTFQTIKVHTRSKDKGSENFKEKGETFTWFTDNQYKIPVKIEVKIKVGYIRAELVKIDKGEGSNP